MISPLTTNPTRIHFNRPSLAHHLEGGAEEDYYEEAVTSGDLAPEDFTRLRIRSWLTSMKDSRRQGAFKLTKTKEGQSALSDCKC